MNIRYRRYFAVVAVALAFETGCASSASQKAPPRAILTPNGPDAEIAERILKLTPVGTPIDTAKQTLFDAGLRCSTETDAESSETYLSCGYSDERDFWITWVWSIRVEFSNSLVSGVSCKRAGVGP